MIDALKRAIRAMISSIKPAPIVDLHVNYGSDDYKWLMHVLETGTPVALTGKSRAEVLTLCGAAPGTIIPRKDGEDVPPGWLGMTADGRAFLRKV